MILQCFLLPEPNSISARWFLRLSLLTKSRSVINQIKTTEQYFLVVLLIMLYKVVATFESVDEILTCDRSIDLI